MLHRRLFLELFIAWRYLRGPGRTVIFNLGARLSFFFMAVMVFTMVIVLCVFTGFQKAVHSTLWNSGYHVTVLRQTPGLPLEDYRAVLEAAAQDQNLARLTRSSFPSIQTNALIEVDNRFEGKSLRALPVDEASLERGELKDFPRLVHYNRDFLNRFNGGNYVLVGREMARYFGWQVGTRVRILLPRGGMLARGIEVRQEEFVIAGFFRTGYLEFDLNLIFLSLKTAQRTLEMGDQATEVIFQLKDLGSLDAVEGLVRENLPAPRYNYEVRTLRQERGNFLAALQLEKTMMLIILSLLIVAGAAGIWVTVHMLVKAKSRSIGMLRAMGLPTNSIIAIFTAHSMWIGFLATSVGGTLGIFFANRLEAVIQLVEDVLNAGCQQFLSSCTPISLIPRNIYYFDHLPVEADVTVIFGVALATMILSGLAGYFPSLVAARLDPVQTIRAE